MRQIIDRKVYDTDSAEQIAKHGAIVDKGDFYALAETLYKDSDGEYFLHCRGGAATQYAEQTSDGTTYGETVELLAKEEALDWCEKRSLNSETVLEEFADLIENGSPHPMLGKGLELKPPSRIEPVGRLHETGHCRPLEVVPAQEGRNIGSDPVHDELNQGQMHPDQFRSLLPGDAVPFNAVVVLFLFFNHVSVPFRERSLLQKNCSDPLKLFSGTSCIRSCVREVKA